MTTAQINNLKAANQRHLKRIATLEKRIDDLRDEASSATISAGGGSKSYTNLRIAELRTEIEIHQRAISRNLARMGGGVGRRVYIGRR